MSDLYSKAAEWIQSADGILITAGAGMGVDSGLPGFRGEKGLWNEYPALGQQSMSFYDIADPEMFVRDPLTAWGFYGHRLELYRNTVAHDGFNILKKWASDKPYGLFVFTSNVDGQFQKAGFEPELIYECHGSIHQMQCSDYCPDVWPSDGYIPEVDQEQCKLLSELPKCPQCGYTARPNILMFGDQYWDNQLYQKQQKRYFDWSESVKNLVVIEIGAGSNIPTVRRESERRAGKRLIRINPREPDIQKDQGVSFANGAAATLLLLDCVLSEKKRDELMRESTLDDDELFEKILNGERVEYPEIYPTFEEAISYDKYSNAQQAIRDLLRVEQTIRTRDEMCQTEGGFYWERRHYYNQWNDFFGIRLRKTSFELEKTSPLYLRNFLASDGLKFAEFSLDVDCKDIELLENLLEAYRGWVEKHF